MTVIHLILHAWSDKLELLLNIQVRLKSGQLANTVIHSILHTWSAKHELLSNIQVRLKSDQRDRNDCYTFYPTYIFEPLLNIQVRLTSDQIESDDCYTFDPTYIFSWAWAFVQHLSRAKEWPNRKWWLSYIWSYMHY